MINFPKQVRKPSGEIVSGYAKDFILRNDYVGEIEIEYDGNSITLENEDIEVLRQVVEVALEMKKKELEVLELESERGEQSKQDSLLDGLEGI